MASRTKTPGGLLGTKSTAPKASTVSGSKRSPAATSTSTAGDADLQKELRECKAEITCLRAKFNPADIEKYKIQTVTTEQMFQDALIKAEKDLKAYEAGQSDSPMVKELREKVYKKDKEISAMKKTAQHGAEEMTILKRRCKSLDEELLKLKAQHENVLKQLTTKDEIRKLEAYYRQYIEELKGKLAVAESRIQKLPNIFAKRYDAESIQNELTDAKKDNELLRQKLSDMKRKATEKENESAEFAYGNKELAEKFKKQQSDNESLRTKNEELNKSANTLKSQLASLQRNRAQGEDNVAKIKKLETEISKLQTQYSEQETEITKLESVISKLRAKHSEQDTEITKLKSYIAQLKTEISNRDTHISKLEIQKSKQDSDTLSNNQQSLALKARISQLEDELKTAVDESDKLRKEVRNLATELKESKSNYKSSRESKEKLEDELSKLQKEADKLRREIAEQAEILHERDVEIDSLQEKLSGAGDMYRSVDGRISGTDQEMSRLQRECNELEAKLKVEKDAHSRTKNEKEELEMKCHDAFEKISQKEKKLAQQESNHKQLIDRKDTTIKELRKERTMVDPYANSRPDQVTVEANLKKTMEQLEQLKKENNELKSRLSKALGTHLLDGNSNLADLSDPHSPEKLVEQLSQVYDNEWTDMFECCEIEYGETKKSVVTLFTVLTDIYTFCQAHAHKTMKKLYDTLHSLSNSKERFDIKQIPPIRLQKLRELTKWFAPDLTATVIKEYLDNQKIKLPRRDIADRYVSSCVEVCWLMCVQTPPVVMDTTPTPGAFDESLYRPYTKGGHTIDYVVWPPVRLHENGQLICKGIAQAQGR